MKSGWLQDTVLRAASVLAPGDQRGDWLEEWRSELWYIPRRGATRFCLGAFRDALWLRRNDASRAQRSPIHLESPLGCLAFLAAIAAVSAFIAVRLPAPRVMGPSAHVGARGLLEGCMAMLLISCVFLPATGLAMGRAPADGHAMPWRGRLRRGIFLALKIVLVQPVLFGGFVAMVWIGPVVPVGPNLAVGAAWVLIFRWVIGDQRRRCPVCLRLLANPVRIGNLSHTFLEWHGAESICSHGHGLRLMPEIAASYGGKQEWLDLDDSWRGAFSEAAGARQR